MRDQEIQSVFFYQGADRVLVKFENGDAESMRLAAFEAKYGPKEGEPVVPAEEPVVEEPKRRNRGRTETPAEVAEVVPAAVEEKAEG